MVAPDDAEAARGGWFADRVRALLPDLQGAARAMTRNDADAQDLIADAVARAWLRLDTLKDPAAFRGWIFRILTNGYISLRRREHARGPHESYDRDLEPEDEAFSLFDRLHQPFLLWGGSNPEREFLNRLLREDIERAMGWLPEVFRVVVSLADVQGFSYREIAGFLRVPIGTVRSRLARGRSQLQRALWRQAADAGLIPGERSNERGDT